MTNRRKPSLPERWALLRFSVVGPLLASPPERGELQKALLALATRKWMHPATEEPTQFAASTIERWYYQVREHHDPVSVLRKKRRKDSGQHRALGERLRQALLAQYAAHKSWSYQLHYDNLAALVRKESALGPLPSYASVRRYMKAHGLTKRRRIGSGQKTDGMLAAEQRFEDREVRSYEAAHVNALWHFDFHSGSLKILTPKGELVVPHLLGILDDHSRLACHVQWYIDGDESAEQLVHGLSQAIQKRGLPRGLLSDRGSAMRSGEVREGCARLSVTHDMTLPYSPYQNGKQEAFWTPVEARLLAMLEGCRDLTLAALNEATQAWVELEYNRSLHSEIGVTPLSRFLSGASVGRPSPSSDVLRLAFMVQERRTQRRSDGTVSIGGRRFEIPSRYGHFERVSVRYASWDLSHVYLADEHEVLCRIYPLDRQKNADGLRRLRNMPLALPAPTAAPGMAPLLAQLIAEYRASGLPPAYLPKSERKEDDTE
jgi:putative transposase